MLTTGELALVTAVLAPLLGLLGVVAGTWSARSSSRQQQRIDARQRHYEQRAATYENMLVAMNRGVLAVDARLRGAAKEFERDQAADHEAALWRARGMLVASDEVRQAFNGWSERLSSRILILGLPEASREMARLQWLQEVAAETLKVSRAMAADLKELRALP